MISRSSAHRSIAWRPNKVRPLPEALTAIAEADVISLGRDLFTSVIPNLLVEGMATAIRNSPAPALLREPDVAARGDDRVRAATTCARSTSTPAAG